MTNANHLNNEKTFDVVGFIVEYESDLLTEDQIIEGFQHLINSGMVWNLQGSYGRTATALIEAGYCKQKEK